MSLGQSLDPGCPFWSEASLLISLLCPHWAGSVWPFSLPAFSYLSIVNHQPLRSSHVLLLFLFFIQFTNIASSSKLLSPVLGVRQVSRQLDLLLLKQ